MSLLILDHLQAMLERAQEAVSFAELILCIARDDLPVGERAQRIDCPPLAQGGDAPAQDQLLRLREKLDLANAAAAELDVVPGDGDLAVPRMRVDLALDRVNIGDRRVVEIFAPDKGLELGEEFLPYLDVAPNAWVLPLKFSGGGLVGSGKAMFTSEGDAWIASNFAFGMQGTDAFWNGTIPGVDHAQTYLGAVTRQGECWVNDQAKICASPPGKRKP